jgi:hypothetical protein
MSRRVKQVIKRAIRAYQKQCAEFKGHEDTDMVAAYHDDLNEYRKLLALLESGDTGKAADMYNNLDTAAAENIVSCAVFPDEVRALEKAFNIEIYG